MTRPNLKGAATVTLPIGAELTIEMVNIYDISLPDNYCGMDMGQVEKYTNFLHDGFVLEPVLIFHDEDRYWLIDGRHRYVAALIAGNSCLRAVVTDSLRMVA